MIQIEGLNNTLDKIILDYEDIEKQIISYELSFPQTRRQDIEWKMHLPMFVPAFYKYVIEKGLIPTQQDYWGTYLRLNSAFFDNTYLSDQQIEGLRARVFRTYPSLVRDLHFGLTLKFSNDFNDVFYNEIIDIQYGIDLVVIINNRLLGINLYTYTDIAIKARRLKEYRPKKKVDFKCIELPIKFKDSKLCGQFFLYSDRQLEQVRKELLMSL